MAPSGPPAGPASVDVPSDDAIAQSEYRQEAFQQANTFFRSKVRPAEQEYQRALSSLWVGNAGASLATLSFMGAAWKESAGVRPLLFPLGLFLLGLVSMAVGTIVSLIKDAKRLDRLQRAESLLQIHMGDVAMPTEEAGFTFKDPRTVSGVVSAGCFIGGCLVGFAELWCNAP